MSASDSGDSQPGAVAVFKNPIPGARPWPKGVSGSPGGLTRNERAFRSAMENEFIPAAVEVLRAMLADSRNEKLGPDTRQKCRMDFMKCTGLIPKQSDTAAIQEAAKAVVEGMIDAARAKREGAGG